MHQVEADPDCQKVLACRMRDGMLNDCPIFFRRSFIPPQQGGGQWFTGWVSLPSCLACFWQWFRSSCIANSQNKGVSKSGSWGCLQKWQSTRIWRWTLMPGGWSIPCHWWSWTVTQLMVSWVVISLKELRSFLSSLRSWALLENVSHLLAKPMRSLLQHVLRDSHSLVMCCGTFFCKEHVATFSP